LHNEPAYKRHQDFIDIIYVEDFKQSKNDVDNIKSEAKSLLEKLQNSGIKF
jgi:hypothetical protein